MLWHSPWKKHLVVLTVGDGITGFFIEGDRGVIKVPKTNILNATVLLLLVSYYVFDLDYYPRVYANFWVFSKLKLTKF